MADQNQTGASGGRAAEGDREDLTRELQPYRDLFYLNQHGIVIGDVDGQTLGRCNPAFARMLGYSSPEELEGMPIPAIFAPGHAEQALHAIHLTHERGHHQYETLLRRKDGSSFPGLIDFTAVRDANGTTLYRIVNVFDISEIVAAREEAERSARQIRERMELLLESVDIGFGFATVPFRTFEWDARVRRHYWVGPDEAITMKKFFARIHPDDRERVKTQIEDSLKHHAQYDTDYRTVDPKTGAVRWVRSVGTPQYNEQGEPTTFDGFTLDVTARKRLELAREQLLEGERAARAEAEHTSRIKDEFLATLSHELRTPLHAMLGWCQLLRSADVSQAEVAEGIEVIERNARVQAQLVEDLLEMSRIVSGKMRVEIGPVDLTQVVAAAVEVVQPAANARDIRLHQLIDPDAASIAGDASRLQQVVWNLLSNAIKFTPHGGRVDIVLRRVGVCAEIVVRDTGIGIAGEYLPYVFERFWQADASTAKQHRGLGLGLGIAKSLVEMHGGTVAAASEGEGLGATFTVRLPLANLRKQTPEPSESASSDEPALPAGTIDLRNVKVLVVDDEPDARRFVRRMLETSGAEVQTAGSAREARELLEVSAPDVLVCDIGMPVEDGYGLLRWLRADADDRLASTPAVALTAFAHADDRRSALAAGFDVHVAKPVDANELKTTIASLTINR